MIFQRFFLAVSSILATLPKNESPAPLPPACPELLVALGLPAPELPEPGGRVAVAAAAAAAALAACGL
jgi:hypothetical protein